MRHAALPFLIVCALFLSGCVDFFTPSDADIEEAEQADATDDDALNKANDPTAGTDDGDGPDAGTPNGGEPDPAVNESEEPAEPDVAPPNEQLQDSPEDIDRPGEYAMLPKGASNSAVKTQVPTWPLDARWRFHTTSPAGTCEHTKTVTDSDTSFEVPVWVVDTITHNCDRSADDEALHGQADLMKVDDEGCIDHELVFPLEDGKRWRYHPCSASALVNATVDYEPTYLWNLQRVAAWHITLEYSGGNLVLEKWYGIEARNYLKEEVWAPGYSPAAPLVTTKLVSYDH